MAIRSPLKALGPGRLTITLPAAQRRKLSKIATERHVSLATVIRWAIDAYVKPSAGVLGGKEPRDAA